MSHPENDLSPQDLDLISELLRKETAIVLGEAKQYLVSSRLKSVAAQEGFASIPSLIAAVRRTPNAKLRRSVVESLTTNETYFFRDEVLWRYLRASLIPGLLKRREGEKTLSVWCGACSTGQEPYSVAMLLDEFPLLKGWRVRILASDVDESVIERAKAGLYDQFEVNRGLPAKLLAQHFERDGLRWRLRESMRRTVEFRKVNLIGAWHDVGRPDLVFLRNVLIYFDQSTRRTIIGRMAQIMRPDGNLIFGSSEVSHPTNDLFVSVDRASGTYAPANQESLAKPPAR